MNRHILSVALFGFGLGLTTAYALDGTRSPDNIAAANDRVAPPGGLYSGNLADSHADEPTGTAQARFVANAFVRLASYSMTGIPSSNIKPDAVRARDLLSYAASYFGDRDAQYRLGRMYLDGQGVGKDTKQGIRWLSLAADKGQYQAQAVFGAVLFKGQYLARDAAGGLMYLILAREAASVEETWIAELYSAASKQATAEEVTRALDHGKHWIEKSRSGRQE